MRSSCGSGDLQERRSALSTMGTTAFVLERSPLDSATCTVCGGAIPASPGKALGVNVVSLLEQGCCRPHPLQLLQSGPSWSPARVAGHCHLHGRGMGEGGGLLDALRALGSPTPRAPCLFRAPQPANTWLRGFQGTRKSSPTPAVGCKGTWPLLGREERQSPLQQEGPSLAGLPPPPRHPINTSGGSARAPPSGPLGPQPQNQSPSQPQPSLGS